jgi:P-type Cu+ transporter
MEAARAAVPAPIVCRHCGDPCPMAGDAPADGPFCCGGCAAVYAFVNGNGLGAFYACETPPGSTQRTSARDAADGAALDEPAVAARVLRLDTPTLACAEFAVPGLHCASCVWLLERLWGIDARIVRVEVDLLRRSVQVWFQRDRMDLRQVAQLLTAAGYPPEIPRESAPRAGTRERRRLHLQIGLAAFAFGNVMLFSIPRYANGTALEPPFQQLFDGLNIALATPVLLYSASDYLRRAGRAVAMARLTLDVPVALGLLALYARSVADILAGRGPGFMDSFAGLVFFLLIGRLFQQHAFDRIAFDRTYRSFLPLTVRVAHGHEWRATAIEGLRVGDRISLRPQEVVPADAVLVDRRGTIDYAFVTGESTPVAVSGGDRILAGGRVIDRSLRLDVAQPVEQTHLARLWNHPAFATERRHWLTEVSARFGGWFTAATLALAAAGAAAWWPDTGMAIQVASAVLIIACPCALTLAAPVTLGTAMSQLARRGLVLKEPSVAFDLSRIDTIVLDKTGTLTGGDARAAAPPDLSDADWRHVQRLAAESAHPISRAIAAGTGAAGTAAVVDRVEVAGAGLRGLVDGRDVAIGTSAFVSAATGTPIDADQAPAGAAVAIDGRFRGWTRLAAPVRAGIELAVGVLARGYDVWLLSGDGGADAPRWAALFGARLRFRQTPEAKLAFVQASAAAGRHVLMVGDGLNDAGALAAADVGLAVSDDTACLVPACDAVIRGGALASLPALLRYARQARQVIVLCFAVSVVYNVVGLTLALQGHLSPLATAVLMPVSSLTVIGVSSGGMRWLARRMPACA